MYRPKLCPATLKVNVISSESVTERARNIRFRLLDQFMTSFSLAMKQPLNVIKAQVRRIFQFSRNQGLPFKRWSMSILGGSA